MARLRLSQVLEAISGMQEFTVNTTIVKSHLENLEELRGTSGHVANCLEELFSTRYTISTRFFLFIKLTFMN